MGFAGFGNSQLPAKQLNRKFPVREKRLKEGTHRVTIQEIVRLGDRKISIKFGNFKGSFTQHMFVVYEGGDLDPLFRDLIIATIPTTFVIPVVEFLFDHGMDAALFKGLTLEILIEKEEGLALKITSQGTYILFDSHKNQQIGPLFKEAQAARYYAKRHQLEFAYDRIVKFSMIGEHHVQKENYKRVSSAYSLARAKVSNT